MMRVLCPAVLTIALSGTAKAAPGPAGQEPRQQEVTKHKGEPTFKLRVQRNVVLVHVVVRDPKGRVVSNLTKDDFELFDNRKRQVITLFSVEAAPSKAPGPVQPGPGSGPAGAAAKTQAPPPPPQRYLALYFDDLNMEFADVVPARDAADRFLAASLTPTDRVGIFVSSGGPGLDFTDDRTKLHEALFKLRPRSRVSPRTECPEISDYQADRIVNFEDLDAYALAKDEAINRCHQDPRTVTNAFLRMQAQFALDMFELQAHSSLQGLDQIVRRISIMPGQRNIILVSDGFLPLGRQFLLGDLVDRALRSQIVISALDPKGLAVLLPEADASRPYAPSAALGGLQVTYALARDDAASAPLAEIADGTGGQFFHNSNDLDAGFRKVAAAPEVYYVLAFSPENLKYDGRFHILKVNLANPRGFNLRARRGYFAPKQTAHPEEQAKEEIKTAVFSHEELEELPVDIQTQHVKSGAGEEQLTVLVHVDIRALQFREENGRSLNDLTLVTALFDQNGKYLEGKKTEVGMHVSDATLQKLMENGVRVTIPFAVKPGTYTVREVVRESGSGELSALSRQVDIPN